LRFKVYVIAPLDCWSLKHDSRNVDPEKEGLLVDISIGILMESLVDPEVLEPEVLGFTEVTVALKDSHFKLS
jgi:hypothetical protein